MKLMQHVATKKERRCFAGISGIQAGGRRVGEFVIAGIVADAGARDVQIAETLERLLRVRGSARLLL
jgi:hypothetical protein